MEKRPTTPRNKKDAQDKKKNQPLLIIGLISLIFSILLALLFFFWRYNSTHVAYEEISRMTITDTVLPEGYSTDGEVHYSAGSDGYVQFTALGQQLETPSFGPHDSYYISFDVTSLIYYSDDAYDSLVPTFTIIGYDHAGQPMQTVRWLALGLDESASAYFATAGIDHFVIFHSGPALAIDETTQALSGIGHIIVMAAKEISL